MTPLRRKIIAFPHIIIIILAVCGIIPGACSHKSTATDGSHSGQLPAWLVDSLERIAADYPAEIGIALITDSGDTLTVNDCDVYPLMSVFKLHQAISLCHLLEQQGRSIDSAVTLRRDSLNPDTWSPMLTDCPEGDITLSLRQLMNYTLQQSDNNASNYLFASLQPVNAVDSFAATLIPRNSFRLTVTEEQMWADHSLCYSNHSSPLAAAMLINRLFTDSILSSANLRFVRDALGQCITGTDRIVRPLAAEPGVSVAHKTGSGYRDQAGILSAHNDVAFVTLSDGTHYALAVLVKDFHGTEAQAADAIARISDTIYRALR